MYVGVCMGLCSCMRLRLRLPLAMAALVGQGTRPHANPNCQMPDGQTQESHARRVLPRAGNSTLWHSKTDMGFFQNGIALSLPPAAAAQPQPHTQPHTLLEPGPFHTFLLPFCVPPPPATMPPRHLSTRARSTGENTAGRPEIRAVGQSDNRPDLSPTRAQTAKTMLPCLTNQVAPTDDFMSPGRITDSIAYHSARFSVPESAG